MSDKVLRVAPLGFPWQTQDPFLFCAYHYDLYPEGDGTMAAPGNELQGRNIGQDFTIKDGWRMYHGRSVPGFPYHPHRGFETITINKQGVVDHSDSLGAAGRFMGGDVQWMTAGKGIQHSEMFPLLNEDKPNHLEIFQVWLNLPKVSKFVEPHFKMLWREDIPVVEHNDAAGKKTTVDLIAGMMKEQKALDPTPDSWASDSGNAVGVYTVKMEPGAEWTLPATQEGANRSFYFYRGASLEVDGLSVDNGHQIDVAASEDISLKAGAEEVYLLILEGKPINEPVAKYGPFVMNTQQEIQEAIYDYQRTEFGGWPWSKRENVHGKAKGRFALHSNGVEEIK